MEKNREGLQEDKDGNKISNKYTRIIQRLLTSHKLRWNNLKEYWPQIVKNEKINFISDLLSVGVFLIFLFIVFVFIKIGDWYR